MSVRDRDPREWWEHWNAMSDEALVDERFRLYDLAEDLEPVGSSSGAYEFAAVALSVIRRIENMRAIRQQLRSLASVVMPDVDPDAFATAMVELSRAHHELYGSDARGIGIVRGAIEVAERRANVPPTQEGQDG
jgi:hypothetical protein